MIYGPRLSFRYVSYTMFTCLVAQCMSYKSVYRMGCQYRDGKEGPIEVCVSECQKDTLGMHR